MSNNSTTETITTDNHLKMYTYEQTGGLLNSGVGCSGYLWSKHIAAGCKIDLVKLLESYGLTIGQLTGCKLRLCGTMVETCGYRIYGGIEVDPTKNNQSIAGYKNSETYYEYTNPDRYEVPLMEIYAATDRTDFVLEVIDPDPQTFGDDIEWFEETGHTVELTYTGTRKRDYLNIPYGNHSLQKMDIHLPGGTNITHPVPAVVTIHGGSWSGGSKDNDYDYGDTITGLGCAWVNINYRLLGNGGAETDDGKAPYLNMLDDIKGALQCLKDDYSDFIDTNKCALMGYSSGGYLALLYAYKSTGGGITSPIPVKLVISEAGPIDLDKLYNYGVLQSPDNARLAALVGKTEQTVTKEDLNEASPHSYLTNKTPHTVLYYSEYDDLVGGKDQTDFIENYWESNADLAVVVYPEDDYVDHISMMKIAVTRIENDPSFGDIIKWYLLEVT